MMDLLQAKTVSLQAALSSLTLQPREEGEQGPVDNVLIGKVLATRTFRRLILVDIINKAWRLKARVQVEKMGDNLFKFCFSDKADKDRIFQHRPWSLNGSLLILKE